MLRDLETEEIMALDIEYLAVQKAAARQAIGGWDQFRMNAAVLFDRGGDDGYWIRTLPFQNFKKRRCGLLVVTPDAVGYAEVCATGARPGSSLGMLARLARGTKNWACYTWAARKGEISDVSVQHIVHSPYGGYASIAITANGQTMRFGLSEGEPAVLSTVSAIRHLAGTGLSLHGGTPRPPRTDGIYLFGASQLLRPIRFLHFDQSTFVLQDTGKVRTTLDAVLARDSDIQRHPYHWNGDHYLTGEANPNSQKAFIVADDGRLIFDYLIDRGKSPEFGERVFDLAFVPFDEIGENWGEPTVPPGWPMPSWEPVLTSTGEIEAPNIGQVRARAKG